MALTTRVSAPIGVLPSKSRLAVVLLHAVADLLAGGVVADLVKIPLDGGGWVLVATGSGPVQTGPPEQDGPVRSGPVRAGRATDRVEEVLAVASCSLREALAPVTEMSRQVLEEFRQASPSEVKVEFGVQLTAEAGAMVVKAGTGCHLTVTLTWRPDEGSG